MKNRYHIGERVLVTYEHAETFLDACEPLSANAHVARGWLESVDDVAVVVRLPSAQDPETPGDELETFPVPPPRGYGWSVTCTSIIDHHGIRIGYLDPTWSRTEKSARKFVKFCLETRDTVQIEKEVRHDLRVRKLSLAVPLQRARIWNDHGRASMREQADRELAAEDAT